METGAKKVRATLHYSMRINQTCFIRVVYPRAGHRAIKRPRLASLAADFRCSVLHVHGFHDDSCLRELCLMILSITGQAVRERVIFVLTEITCIVRTLLETILHE